MGKRLAGEVLMLDKPLTAKEALDCGFVNAIIPEL
jgi:enoyl-CoA hydratase/carnithine racemase